MTKTTNPDPRKTAEHQKMRAVELQGGTLCYAGCGRPATEIHHPLPISAGGPPFHPDNRVPLCGPCHKAERLNSTFYFEDF